MEISKINDIINAVFPKIATNYSNKELLEMAPQMIGYDIRVDELEKTNNKKYLFIHPEEIQKEYPIPSAFEKYMKLI